MQNTPASNLSAEALQNARKAFLKDVCKMAYIDPREHPLIYSRIDNNTEVVPHQLYKQFFDCIESEFEKSRANGFALTGIHLVRAAGRELRRRILEKGVDKEVERRAETLERKLDGVLARLGEECQGKGLDEKNTFAERHLSHYTVFKRDDLGEPVRDGSGKPVTVPLFDEIELQTCAAVGADSVTRENRPPEEARALIWQHLRSQQGRGKFREEIRYILKRMLRGGDSAEALFLREYDDEGWDAEAKPASAIEDAKVAGMIGGIRKKMAE